MSNETGHEPFVFATRPEPEFSKMASAALDPLREIAAQLAADFSRIQERAREAEQRSATAMETVQDVEQRLGLLPALQDLSRQIDERFAALHALAEEVAIKGQTLNGQKETIEQAEVKLGRLEEVAAETATQLERSGLLRDELGRDMVRLETEVQALCESAQRQVDASRIESGVLEKLRLQLRETEGAIRQTVAEGAALKGVLEEIEQRLGPLVGLQDLSRHTDERFATLQTLAEEVTVKGQTLHEQKEMIERAVVEAGRVAGLVDALDTRLAKLKDGDHLVELTEARFGRLEEVAAETTAQFQRKDRLRDELGLELVRLEMEVQILTESGRRLQDLGRQTDEQFKALNTLAGEVTARGDTLTDQKSMIEQAVVEAGRVAGLVGAMETRMAALKDADHLRELTEARLERLETVAADTTLQLQRSERLRDELRREVVRLETEVQILTALRHEQPAPVGSVAVRVDPPLPGADWEEPSASPDLQLSDLVTRLRTPDTTDVGGVRPHDVGSVRPHDAGSVRLHDVGSVRLHDVGGVRLHDVGSVRLQSDRRRLIRYATAGIGLALLVLASVIALRPFGKPAQIDAKPQPVQTPLPAQASPAFAVSVPVLSGTNVTPAEPRRPTIPTRPPAVATRPPAVATRPPAVDTRPAAATGPAAEYFGTLEVESTPAGAAVFVDQRPVGETPLQLLRVRAGSHAVRIERDGYQRWTTAVNVPASQVTRVTARLDVGR